MDNTIDHGGGGHRVFEDLIPLGEHEVARDHHRASFIALGEQREEDFHFLAVLLDVTNVVEDQDGEPIEPS